jgi:hypothetical protein
MMKKRTVFALSCFGLLVVCRNCAQLNMEISDQIVRREKAHLQWLNLYAKRDTRKAQEEGLRDELPRPVVALAELHLKPPTLKMQYNYYK